MGFSISALFKSIRFLFYSSELSWGPKYPVQMRALLLWWALGKHNTKPALNNLAVFVSEPVRLSHTGTCLRGAHYRWAYYGGNNAIFTASSTLPERQMQSGVLLECRWALVAAFHCRHLPFAYLALLVALGLVLFFPVQRGVSEVCTSALEGEWNLKKRK